ncbi:MAG: hypothetical protein NTV34_06750 [Proteobacteria bacterium]|nr:hypothetical protein [Pseudomonadota bacterium]
MNDSQQNSDRESSLPPRSTGGPTPDPQITWTGGWYLFEDGKVQGPLGAEDVFTRRHETKNGNQRMVSRKGFSQWYPLQDFAELHQLAGKYAHQIGEEYALEATLAASLNNSTQPYQRIATERFAKVQPQTFDIGPDAKRRTFAGDASETRTQREQLNEVSHLRQVPTSHNTINFQDQVRAQAPAASPSTPTSRSSSIGKSTESSKTPSRKDRKQLKYEESLNQSTPRPVSFHAQYLLVSSRLRLGKPRSSFVGAFIFTPLTLFGYWAAWLSRASEEVTWHVTGEHKSHMPLPIWMCLIPGLHLLFAFKLAKMVRAMEQQNGYTTISPWFTASMGIFPPFYIQLIQDALNRHWRLHVNHSARIAA